MLLHQLFHLETQYFGYCKNSRWFAPVFVHTANNDEYLIIKSYDNSHYKRKVRADETYRVVLPVCDATIASKYDFENV